MYLFVFYEFSQPKILEAFKSICKDVPIKQSTTPSFSEHQKVSDNLMNIYRTNTKLFYDNEIHIDDTLKKLESVGFQITERYPISRMDSISKEILVPNDKYFDQGFRACGCFNNMNCQPKMIKQTVINKLYHYYNDRVILQIINEII